MTSDAAGKLSDADLLGRPSSITEFETTRFANRGASTRQTPDFTEMPLSDSANRARNSWPPDGNDRIKVTIGGSIRVPEGGIVVESPYTRTIRAVIVAGLPPLARGIQESRFPATRIRGHWISQI